MSGPFGHVRRQEEDKHDHDTPFTLDCSNELGLLSRKTALENIKLPQPEDASTLGDDCYFHQQDSPVAML